MCIHELNLLWKFLECRTPMEFMLTCKLYFYMICIYAEIKIKSFNPLAYTAKQSCNYNYLHALVHLEATWGHLPPLKFPKIYFFSTYLIFFMGKGYYLYWRTTFFTVKNRQPILNKATLGRKGFKFVQTKGNNFS